MVNKIKAFVRIMGVFGICLFILIIMFQAMPLLPNNTLDTFRLLGQQRSLCTRIAKDTLILAYRPADEHAEALNELQKSLPAWEIEQSFISNDQSLSSDITALFLQSQPDFSSIDTAAKIIEIHPNSFDKEEITIIISNADDYFIKISQTLLLQQNKIMSNAYTYFSIELSLEILLFISWILFITYIYRNLKALS